MFNVSTWGAAKVWRAARTCAARSMTIGGLARDERVSLGRRSTAAAASSWILRGGVDASTALLPLKPCVAVHFEPFSHLLSVIGARLSGRLSLCLPSLALPCCCCNPPQSGAQPQCLAASTTVVPAARAAMMHGNRKRREAKMNTRRYTVVDGEEQRYYALGAGGDEEELLKAAHVCRHLLRLSVCHLAALFSGSPPVTIGSSPGQQLACLAAAATSKMRTAASPAKFPTTACIPPGNTVGNGTKWQRWWSSCKVARSRFQSYAEICCNIYSDIYRNPRCGIGQLHYISSSTRLRKSGNTAAGTVTRLTAIAIISPALLYYVMYSMQEI